MSRSSIITEDDSGLPPIHPGDVFRTEFLEPLATTVGSMAEGLGIERSMLEDFMNGRIDVDAGLDLRLARYFGMSEGFFLGLQADHDLELWRRAHGAELDRIVPRAA